MALHPIFRDILAAHGCPVEDRYRGWLITFDYPPIPCRDFDWSATHPDYDPTPNQAEDGPSDDRVVHGRTREAVMEAIDAWHDDQVPL